MREKVHKHVILHHNKLFISKKNKRNVDDNKTCMDENMHCIYDNINELSLIKK